MNLRLSDLTAAQIRLLERLNDHHPHEDSVGIRMRRLSDREIMSAIDLVQLGLAEVSYGWKDVGWLRLTEFGRALGESGTGA